SLYIDRSVFTDDHDLNVELLVENLRNTIIKKLSVLCITESLISLSALSTASSQSSISVSVTLTSALTTSALSVSVTSAFIISSLCFKKMLCSLDKSCFSRITSLLNSVKILNICVFENRNMHVILFYTCKCEA
ncbi:hypothetical protein BDDG_13532, partial [Blastomyces dermatitidis ATCC 18188]